MPKKITEVTSAESITPADNPTFYVEMGGVFRRITLAQAKELFESAISTDAKMALLACFQKVAWIDDQGQTYYDTLHDALFPTAVSISATFTPGSHVFYETDSLDALRPYLVVRATFPDSSVEIVTDYVLTGSMAVGTNTITVRYQGRTDTFEVTTQANPAYIEAVFTQPQTTIYTDDSLNSLKSNLVVTYYAQPGATGTVLANSAYTLVGTLTEGTSVITAEYQGLTDTFNVTVTGLVTATASDIESYNGLQGFNIANGNITISGGPSSGFGICLFNSDIVRAEFKEVSAYDKRPDSPRPSRFRWFIFGEHENGFYGTDSIDAFIFTYNASTGNYTASKDNTITTLEYQNPDTFAEDAICTAVLSNGVLTIRNENGGMYSFTNANRIGFWGDPNRSVTWNNVKVNP